MLLKDKLKKGEKSIADVRSPEYDPQLFVQAFEPIKIDKRADRLENASIQQESMIIR